MYIYIYILFFFFAEIGGKNCRKYVLYRKELYAFKMPHSCLMAGHQCDCWFSI